MYAALPIMSVYLGHDSIYATEGYLRLTIIEQRDIKDNPNVIAEAVQSTIEKLQAELDSYKSRATTL